MLKTYNHLKLCNTKLHNYYLLANWTLNGKHTTHLHLRTETIAEPLNNSTITKNNIIHMSDLQISQMWWEGFVWYLHARTLGWTVFSFFFFFQKIFQSVQLHYHMANKGSRNHGRSRDHEETFAEEPGDRCVPDGCLQLCLTRLRGGPIGGICWVASARNASAIRCGCVCIIDFQPGVSITSVAWLLIHKEKNSVNVKSLLTS